MLETSVAVRSFFFIFHVQDDSDHSLSLDLQKQNPAKQEPNVRGVFLWFSRLGVGLQEGHLVSKSCESLSHWLKIVII